VSRGRAAAGAFVTLAALCGASARADDQVTALPCRPTIACTADIVPPGALELEVGYLYRSLNGGVNQHSVPFLFKLTLARWLQLQVGGNGPTFADRPVPVRYVDDVDFGFKLHLVDQTAGRPSMAVSAALSVPLADDMPGFVRTYDVLVTAYATKDIAWLHADLNAGLNLWRVEGPIAAQPWVALALSAPLPAGLGAMIEGYYFARAQPLAPRDAGLLLAASYSPRPWIVLDAGGDLGLVRSTRAASAFVGLTVVPIVLW
jgi:hypothetical protein